jgi:hypothetical protein
MGKRDPNRDHPDPEVRRWKKKYRKFPGVAECVRLIREGYANDAWMDIIVCELTENAKDCLCELMETFQAEKEIGGVGTFTLLAAIELAKLPEAAPFLAELLKEGNPRFTPYAMRGLRAIDTPESRKVLWEAAKSTDDSNPY